MSTRPTTTAAAHSKKRNAAHDPELTMGRNNKALRHGEAGDAPTTLDGGGAYLLFFLCLVAFDFKPV